MEQHIRLKIFYKNEPIVSHRRQVEIDIYDMKCLLVKVLKDLHSFSSVRNFLWVENQKEKARGVPSERLVLTNFISTYNLFRWNKTQNQD